MTTQNQLGKILWSIADQLRGAMDPDNFRDYILSFLFLYYLSDNYEAAAKKELGEDYPELEEGDKCTPLSLWYEANGEDVSEFEKQMRLNIHYVMQPSHLWSNISELARTNSNDLLRIIEDGFRYIENQSFESTFKGLFSEINLNSEKLGKNYSERNQLLCRIIKEIAKGINELSTNCDILGDSYEYLIGQFAAGAGKKAGEFYTPQAVSSILSRIVILDSQDPRLGKIKKLNNVLDFACGSGALLLNIRSQLGSDGIGKIYGQEKNLTTYNLARMNMLMHGMKIAEFALHHGDSLANDWDILTEMNPAKKLSFDAVVANPPFGYSWEPAETIGEDFRFKDYGIAPKSCADFAFLLHGFHYLSDSGSMTIILSPGVLFRGGREEHIRKKLLKDRNIDTVISLPAKLFFSTGIAVCILVLKKCRKFDDILFIDASQNFEKDRNQNRLKPEHIDKIVQTYRFRKEENAYSRRVPIEEIEENDYILSINRYIDTTPPEEEIDIMETVRQLAKLKRKEVETKARLNEFLKELGLEQV